MNQADPMFYGVLHILMVATFGGVMRQCCLHKLILSFFLGLLLPGLLPSLAKKAILHFRSFSAFPRKMAYQTTRLMRSW
jgi:hypothetical protein